MNYMTAIGLTFGILMSANALADTIDLQAGKALLEQSCVKCHASKFNGNPTQVYTRPNHKVKSLDQLNSQVRSCSVNNNTGWFPAEEANVAAYLNQKYYKFK